MTVEPVLDSEGLWSNGASASCITTYTRRRVDPLNATVEDIDILDIANALARQCRYNGHCYGHLSVARHSIWVSQQLPERLQLTGLLHDAAEAYMGDLVKPLKHSEFGEAYLEAEHRLERVIAEKFGLRFPMPAEVKEADRYITVEVEIPTWRWAWDSSYTKDLHDFMRHYHELVG